MQYRHIRPAVFLSRPNRFIALVDSGEGLLRAHVKNTGRCAELLIPGCRAYLEYSDNPARSTLCDLVAVEKQRPGHKPLLVNLDSAAPNAAAGEWLAAGGAGPFEQLRPEYRLHGSRFDFYGLRPGGRPVLVEVKGCTLEEDGFARFPDAPTLRGEKHVRELTVLQGQGYECFVLFVLQMSPMRRFAPNWATHPAFGKALCEARAAGVQLLAYDCEVTPDSMCLRGAVPIEL